jgi:hypothetical protein
MGLMVELTHTETSLELSSNEQSREGEGAQAMNLSNSISELALASL